MKPSRDANGFTLIEILVALVILSIALLALAGLMVTTTRNNAAGGHLTEAATFAQDTLERLNVSPLTSIPVNIITTDNPLGSTGISYTRSWTAVPAADNSHYTVTITVSWTDPAKRQPHSIRIPTSVPR